MSSAAAEPLDGVPTADSDLDEEEEAEIELQRRRVVQMHKSAISFQGTRKEEAKRVREREVHDLQEEVARLTAELEAMERRYTRVVAEREDAETQLRDSSVVSLESDAALQSAQHELQEVRKTLAQRTRERDHFSEEVDMLDAKRRERQAAARRLIEWAETKERHTIHELALSTLASLKSLHHPPARKRDPNPQHAVTMLEAMERLRRSDLIASEGRELQQLLHQWTHLAQLAYDARHQATPVRQPSHSHRTPSPSTSRPASAASGARPWYPPGPTHASPPHPLLRKTRSPSASPRSGMRGARGAGGQPASSLSNMQHLLDKLALWSEGAAGSS